MRLAKYLAHAGVASRRAAEAIIAEGRVSIDGETVTDPARDVSTQSVEVDGKAVSIRDDTVVYVVNKPAGMISSASDDRGRRTVVELVKSSRRLYPVGRLDEDTTGLLLLTDDGDLAYRLTHPSFEIPRVYHAYLKKSPIREPELRRLREGVLLEDGRTSPARVRRLRADLIEITIHEGKKRQVRRMCEAVGHPVERLIRVAFGPLRLDLDEGAARRLKAAEVERLRKAASIRRR